MTVEPRARDVATPARAGTSRLHGLDGLRAAAIVSVLVFHLDPRWLPGGFLGVDVFFVISGFLITTLLIRERVLTGRVDLAGFWTRRARRLLPALVVLVPSCILLARLVEGDLLVGIGRQTLGALTFSSNWLEIAAGSDYFNATTPQLFMNLWSLAVEEQFYLVWPLVAIALLRVAPSWRARAGVALALALGSSLLMAVRYDPLSATRVYYGTDTHLMGLMIGAALAFAYAAPHRAWTTSPVWAQWRTRAVTAALVVLVASMWLLDEHTAFTFRGGILLASLATAVLVLAAVEAPGRLRTVLDLPALRWVGERSYGLYLWHWPVILIVDQDLDAASGGGMGYVWTRAWAVLVTVAIADLSYRFVETPVRRLGLRGAARAALARMRLGSVRRARVLWSAALVAAVALVAVLVTAPARTSTEELIEANQAIADAPADRPSPHASATTSPPAPGGRRAWAMPTGAEIDGYGDSMMVGSVHALRYYFPGIRIDAKSNRRWSAGLEQVRARGHDNRRAVVLALGTNAGTDPEAIKATLDALGPQRMVVIVGTAGRSSRVESDNAALADAVAGRPNVAIADWQAALKGTSGQLQSDGIHPSLRGAHLYAATVRQAFADLSERHTGTPVKLTPLPVP